MSQFSLFSSSSFFSCTRFRVSAGFGRVSPSCFPLFLVHAPRFLPSPLAPNTNHGPYLRLFASPTFALDVKRRSSTLRTRKTSTCPFFDDAKTHNKEEADAQIHCAQPASDGERDCEAQNLILSSPVLTLHVSFAHRFFTFPCSNHDLFHRAFPALVCPPRCFYFPCVAAGAAIVQLLPLPFPSPCRQQKEMRAEEMRGWRQFAIHQRFAMCCTFGFPLPLPSFSAFPTFPFGITSSQPPTAHSSSRRHPISARNNSR